MKAARVYAAFLITIVSPALLGADANEIELKLGSYYIKPDKITVKAGQPVTLKIVNESTIVPHNLVIVAPEAGIDVRVEVRGGKTASASFTPGKAGIYQMFCDKKLLFMASHKEKGMKAVLEVVD